MNRSKVLFSFSVSPAVFDKRSEPLEPNCKPREPYLCLACRPAPQREAR